MNHDVLEVCSVTLLITHGVVLYSKEHKRPCCKVGLQDAEIQHF